MYFEAQVSRIQHNNYDFINMFHYGDDSNFINQHKLTCCGGYPLWVATESSNSGQDNNPKRPKKKVITIQLKNRVFLNMLGVHSKDMSVITVTCHI